MAFEYASCRNSEYYGRAALPPDARPQRMLGGTALTCIVLACAWTLYVNLAGRNLAGQNLAAEDFVSQDFVSQDAANQDAGQIDIAATRGDRLDRVAGRGDRLAVTTRAAAPSNAAASAGYLALFDPRSLGAAPGMFVKRLFANNTPPQSGERAPTAAPQSTVQAARDIPPLPRPAPQIRAAAIREHSQQVERVAASAPAEPTIFERLFGKPASQSLAYASPDDGVAGDGHGSAAGRSGGQTAVYDIAAHTVYLPDGRRLEAHSGYGDLLDDPRHADVRMRGVTPPTVYDLTEREASFHGVRALRLTPVDENKVFGRAGLLAHSYMLGPNGDSNGCVSFKDYDAFLQAYLNGEVKRLVVVAGRE
jgi:hypothetical protein